MNQKIILSNLFTCLTVFALMVGGAHAAQSPVNFGAADNFTIFAQTTITDANPSVSRITGDIGIDPAAGSLITDISCKNVNGKIYENNAGYTGGYDTNTTCAVVDAPFVLAAGSAMVTAYGDARGRTGTNITEFGAGHLAGLILAPGLYKWSSAVDITADVTLNGSSTDVWILQIAQTLGISPATKVLLIGGAQASNIFWQVDTSVLLDTTSVFNGNILAGTAITINSGAILNGRAFAQSAVTLSGNNVSFPVSGTPVLNTITLSPTSANLTIGSTLQLNVTKLDQFGAPIDANISYASSNLSVATVNATTGLVNAVAVGNAIINATSGAVIGTSVITVQNAPPVLTHIGSRSVTQGTLINFTITATSSSVQPLNFSSPPGKPATANFTDNHNGTATFTWMPNSSDVGIHIVNFTVTDGIKSTKETVAITVNALQAPITVPTNPPANRLAVNLGTAGDFVILAKSGISTTGLSSIVGDIGVSPAAATYITGFGVLPLDPSECFSTAPLITGKVYAADYNTLGCTTPAKMTTAVSDMQTAYTDAAGRTLPDATELYSGDLSGRTITPGLYKWSTGVLINAPGVTLDCQGNANAVYIFQIAQTLTVGNGAIVTLSGGCQAQNIFWQVAGQATLGTTSVFNGNILDQTAIVMNTGATLNGRALAQTAVTLDATSVSVPAVAAPPAIIYTAWKNAGAYNITLNATGFNNTPIAYINYSLNNVSGQINGGFGNVPINTSINNTLVFYAVDTSGNVETPNTLYTVLDSIAPNITSFTLSATSVNTGDGLTGLCTATDNFDPTPITVITGIDTSTAGTKTATCTATDSAGNVATASAAYTVSTVPAAAVYTVSSGGGGSWISTPSNPQSVKSFFEMAQGVHSVNFTAVGLEITNIGITTTGNATNVRLTVTHLAGKPSSVPTPQIEHIYGYLEIVHTNLDNSVIGSARIQFKVDKAWMASNGLQAGQIALYRFTSTWDLLDTKLVSQDSAYYYFEAISPGLSYFVIGTVVKAVPTTPPVTTPVTPTPPVPPAPQPPAEVVTPQQPAPEEQPAVEQPAAPQAPIAPTGFALIAQGLINNLVYVVGIAVVAIAGVALYLRQRSKSKKQ